MLGRKEELNHLNELYNSDCFEYLVMYGRRRVGKTTILQEFAEHSNAIFFPAREKNDALNLEDFSKVIQYHFDKNFIASFKSWEDAFNYIGEKATEKIAVIIDEFPYIIDENPSVKSILQHVIERNWKKKNISLKMAKQKLWILKDKLSASINKVQKSPVNKH